VIATTSSPPGREFAGFRTHALDFLRRLRRNNTRPWFEAHRQVYESELLQPMRALVEEMDARLARLAPEIIGDPKRSIFRIHRDIRFSNDKSPYKTHVACWFFHQDAGRLAGGGPDGGAAGFYFHLSPDASYVGAGAWMPPRPALTRIRDAIVADIPAFEKTLGTAAFRRHYGGLDTEHMLTRLPRGYSAGTRAERWLRFQSFTATRTLTTDEVLGFRLPSVLIRDFRRLLPLVRWLNSALGYRPSLRRL
jgi:uncharacterized protein (TIGR02453 family)